MIILHLAELFLELWNVSDKRCREHEKKNIFYAQIFFPENRVVDGIMWKNIVHPDMSQKTAG